MQSFWTTDRYTYSLQTNTTAATSSGTYYYNTRPDYMRIDWPTHVAYDELAELITKAVQKDAEELKQKQAQDHEAWLQCFEEE